MNVTFNTVNTTPKNQNCKFKNSKAQKSAFGAVEVTIPKQIREIPSIKTRIDALKKLYLDRTNIVDNLKYPDYPNSMDKILFIGKNRESDGIIHRTLKSMNKFLKGTGHKIEPKYVKNS